MSVRGVLIGYVITLLAAAAGTPVLILGWVKADRCTEPGFGCLGFYFFGIAGAALIAAAVLLALALAFRTGVVFWLTVLAVMIVPNLISNWQPLVPVTLIVAPAVGAWVALPPKHRTRWSATEPRRWLVRTGALVVLIVVVPMLLRLGLIG